MKRIHNLKHINKGGVKMGLGSFIKNKLLGLFLLVVGFACIPFALAGFGTKGYEWLGILLSITALISLIASAYFIRN